MNPEQVNTIVSIAWEKARAALLERKLTPEVHSQACWAIGYYEAEIVTQLLKAGE